MGRIPIAAERAPRHRTDVAVLGMLVVGVLVGSGAIATSRTGAAGEPTRTMALAIAGAVVGGLLGAALRLGTLTAFVAPELWGMAGLCSFLFVASAGHGLRVGGGSWRAR